MSTPGRELRQLFEAELTRPAPPAAEALAREIQARLGAATAAVVFYGSCLRRRTAEGVLDFYALVDEYPAAYGRRRMLARLNRWLPPNVFFLELEAPGGTLRCKYAVLSLRDFARATGPDGLRTGVWARFCQPALAAYLRDAPARALLVEGATRSLTTALEKLVPLDPAADGAHPLTAEQFWPRAFAATYAYEMRPERDASIRDLWAADPERYRQALSAGLALLAEHGEIELERRDGALFARVPADDRHRAARRWRWRRPLAKAVYAAALVKTAFTFGDWLPYALWKLQRHSGTRIVASERQRRHPFLWGWPLLVRVLRQRVLR